MKGFARERLDARFLGNSFLIDAKNNKVTFLMKMS